MGNIEENGENVDSVTLIGKTIKDNDNNSTALVISSEFAKELDMENSKVSMSLLYDSDGNRYLLVTKYYKEIVV